MRLFITGGLGFIGSNFILKQINEYNHTILNYDKGTYAANPNNLLSINSNNLYNFKRGDIVDRKNLNECINNFKPDYIVNFAAESHVDRSIDGPKDFIETNIVGTYELLQSSMQYFKSLSKENRSKFRFLHIYSA